MKIEVKTEKFCPDRCCYMHLDHDDVLDPEGVVVRTYYCSDAERCFRLREYWLRQADKEGE